MKILIAHKCPPPRMYPSAGAPTNETGITAQQHAAENALGRLQAWRQIVGYAGDGILQAVGVEESGARSRPVGRSRDQPAVAISHNGDRWAIVRVRPDCAAETEARHGLKREEPAQFRVSNGRDPDL